MKDYQPWIEQLQATLAQQACVLVSLRQIMGSAPRESGCRMIVTAASVHGSIGGGNLEYTAIAKARDLLHASKVPRQVLEPFGLGPELNQCCGGAVHLLFEYLPPGRLQWLDDGAALLASNQPLVLATILDEDLPRHYAIGAGAPLPAGCPERVWQAADQMLGGESPAAAANDSAPELELEVDRSTWWLERIDDPRTDLWLFGAGHVGQEVAQRIRGLPFRLCWIDQREGVFPEDAGEFARLVSTDPVAAVQASRPGSMFVVMTHSHQLDEDICHALLRRREPGWDFAWLGLIGSATKRKRFVHRLRQRGIPEKQLQRLVCPIGLSGIRGKQPATIALSLLAQLMMLPG